MQNTGNSEAVEHFEWTNTVQKETPSLYHGFKKQLLQKKHWKLMQCKFFCHTKSTTAWNCVIGNREIYQYRSCITGWGKSRNAKWDSGMQKEH